MPNTYIKVEQYLATFLAALNVRSLLPSIFTRTPADAFASAEGDTLYWKTNRVTTARDYEWRTRTAPIILDKIGQARVAITLDKHVYNGVPITAEELTLDLKRFATEIAQPQAESVRDRIEQKVVKGLRAADFKTAIPAFYEDDDPWTVVRGIRRILNDNGCPADNRYLLVGSQVEDWMLGAERVAPVADGITNPAVRNATIGQIGGMTIVPSSMLAEDEIFAVVPSTLVIASGAPALPLGLADAQKARASYEGYEMLLTIAYDQRFQQDASVFSTFLGVNSIEDELATTTDADGFTILDLDEDGNPTLTGKNVRGAKGTITDGNRP